MLELRGLYKIDRTAQYDRKMKNKNIFDEVAEKYDVWYGSDEGMLIYKSELLCLTEAKVVLMTDGSIIIGIVPKDSPWGIWYEKKKEEGHVFYSHAKFYALRDIKTFLKTIDMQITEISSTLLQHPDEPRRMELPVKKYVEGAGFICIKAKIRSNT